MKESFLSKKNNNVLNYNDPVFLKSRSTIKSLCNSNETYATVNIAISMRPKDHLSFKNTHRLTFSCFFIIKDQGLKIFS